MMVTADSDDLPYKESRDFEGAKWRNEVPRSSGKENYLIAECRGGGLGVQRLAVGGILGGIWRGGWGFRAGS